ncbi:crossover junction endodeoxyribonuclease RuvC [Parvicella tangerina]|uniref:Crossover junction endodeoxyribonuclease RuvC n=1 Tax=Parvicella tangerina TaxID=2829795 RepID=A0A916JLL5_9FLAO|nr:crossover junction endodeoxyribonuclease RuvC [Parvicella tangerina]CAG5080559.1 Crossover junction endodeoxyribonuclease RuvC [Parvicella tangerina]
MKDYDKIILGLDPGTNVMGYGLIGVQKKKLLLINTGVIHLAKLENHQLKLKSIFEKVSFLVKEYLPDEVAVEAPFFGKNVQSMLKLGRAQGVAMAAVLTHDLPIVEYSPKKIKQSITGNGNASKEQVAAMLQSILNFKELPKYLDATDGLAAAVCHHFQGGAGEKKKSYSGWDAFLKDNPDRKK